jgi:SAM-dependent methyltransferase
MRNDAIELEESRLQGIEKIEDYPWFKDRHRVFPSIFENRRHTRIIDTSAGVGCVAKRIKDKYPVELICNDISPTCIKIMKSMGLTTVSFDLDDKNKPFPFHDGFFDAVISLVTIEHLMEPNHFLCEINRILENDGYLYISTPNYASLNYVLSLVFTGKSFHDPIKDPYEFYAHVRYFTYKTLLELVSSLGFVLDSVYIALPEMNTQYRDLLSRSRGRAFINRYGRWLMYHLLSPRWTAEPILCFQKSSDRLDRKVRKVIL